MRSGVTAAARFGLVLLVGFRRGHVETDAADLPHVRGIAAAFARFGGCGGVRVHGRELYALTAGNALIHGQFALNVGGRHRRMSGQQGFVALFDGRLFVGRYAPGTLDIRQSGDIIAGGLMGSAQAGIGLRQLSIAPPASVAAVSYRAMAVFVSLRSTAWRPWARHRSKTTQAPEAAAAGVAAWIAVSSPSPNKDLFQIDCFIAFPP